MIESNTKDVGQSMQSTQENWVELSDFNYCLGDRTILQNLNMKFATGKLTVLLGPSGSGKSSLLKMIGGQFEKHDAKLSGSVRVNGRDILSMTGSDLSILRKQMGVLFQRDALFGDLSVFDNVAFPLREHTGLPENMVRDIVLLKLNAVGLRAARDLLPHQLSAGMARRVALARAFALDPPYMLYDEPFRAQDPISTAILRKLIEQLSADLQVSGILISHNIEISLGIADYVYLMNEGRIVEEGCPHQLQCSSSAWVQQFLHGSLLGPAPFHYPGPSLRADLLEQTLPPSKGVDQTSEARNCLPGLCRNPRKLPRIAQRFNPNDARSETTVGVTKRKSA